MRLILLIAVSFALLGCATTSKTGNVNAGVDQDQERFAYEQTGDVRVFCLLKQQTLQSTHNKGTQVEQERQTYILVNKSHTFRQGMPDHKIPPHERFLDDSNMYNLLLVLRDQLGFFNYATNILGEDPIARADADPRVTRMLAVEVIVNGKVNTSYFAWREGDGMQRETQDRAKTYNLCQGVFLEALAAALPRGTADYGAPDKDALGKGR